MHLNSLAWGALLCRPILTLSIPTQHGAQIPIRVEEQKTTKPVANSVILAYTSDGTDRVQHAELPLQQQISSGVDLPAHPGSIRIETMLNDKGGFVSLEELDQVMCRVIPRLSMEEKASLEAVGMGKAWPWFKIRDETVSFKKSSSRWFLAGRSIQSYECR
ncbi:hypothetical protein HBI70_081930 [Parastagonospora nodorum]|nr:hypothetical protein HBH53_201870 [Parastagonospora nodorum]KAH4060012.1 hypothetical protein HBH50_225620 [Parastagonospora nodorum]KAH4077516.1 hypothetical protein HBH48_240900 [Parastagonospora nodorum]KAH4206032.1 hypothetical protein HBI95_123140 [Parastagonospora nodorum]KAH4404400.1 hypothetical protein HBH92_193750 [Parastagonospora nodorum]